MFQDIPYSVGFIITKIFISILLAILIFQIVSLQIHIKDAYVIVKVFCGFEIHLSIKKRTKMSEKLRRSHSKALRMLVAQVRERECFTFSCIISGDQSNYILIWTDFNHGTHVCLRIRIARARQSEG